MADPLSISASIAGLVTLADTVFLRLTKYIKSVKNCDKEIDELCKEVNLLGGAVNMLARLARGYELEDEPFNQEFRMHHIEGCASILADISQKTKKYDSNSRSKALKLIWPYTSSKTKELLADLSRHKENINLALTANSMEALLRCLAKDEDRAKTTAEIRADVRKTREIVVRVQADDRQNNVLQFFLSYNPQPHYEMCLKLRHPRTGLWLERLPSFQTWLSSSNSRLWLSGIPGAGKTVLAGSIIAQALARSSDNVATGFFFCDYTNDITQRPASVLGTLAYQLARQKKQAYLILEGYYSELHPEKGLPRSPDPDDLVRVISTMAQMFDHVYLVIDGLDECQDSTEEVVRVLCALAESSDEISMAVLSRNENNIREYLQGPKMNFVNIQIAAHKSDITEYVTSEIQQRIMTKRLHLDDPSIKGEIVDGLVDGANGMFRWVACQLDNLGCCMSDEQCREALHSLPPDLPETYLRILKRIPKPQQPFVQTTLNLIAYADPKLSFEQLRELLSIPANSSQLKDTGLVREDAITRHCSSLVRKSHDGKYLEFAHSSVQEFLRSDVLQSSGLQMFIVSAARCSRILAIRSVEYLQLNNFSYLPSMARRRHEEMRIAILKHPFYSYAATNWIYHARETWEDPELLAGARRLFDPRKTACFTFWAITLARDLVSHIPDSGIEEQEKMAAKIVDECFRPLHFAVTLSLPAITSFLLTHTATQEKETFKETIYDYAINCLVGTLYRCGTFETIPTNLRRFLGTATSTTQFTLETIRILIGHFNKLPDGLVRLAFRCWARTFDFSIVELLVVEGATLFQSDLDEFDVEMKRRATREKNSENTKSLFRFCEFLSTMIDKSALHFELCLRAWRFCLNLADHPDEMKAYEIDSRISEDPSSLKRLAMRGCQQLLVDTLQSVVDDPRVDVSSIIDPSTGNGLLHTLVLSSLSKASADIDPSRWASKIDEMLDVLSRGGCSHSLRNNGGDTPLSFALKQENFRFANLLLRRPCLDSGAWDSSTPILFLVARSSAEEVLDQLLSTGFQPSFDDYNTDTPLHHLQFGASLGLAIRLEQILPGAREIRDNGKMPWEQYLNNTHFNPPSTDVLRFLIKPLLIQSQSVEASHVWDYYTSNLKMGRNYIASDQIVKSLVETGVLRHYEKTRSESGLLTIASIFSGFVRRFLRDCISPIRQATVCLLIERTGYWATFQQSPLAIQLLKLSAAYPFRLILAQLLSRGVGIHQRHDGESALEYVYALPARGEVRLSTIQELLQYADPQMLNQTNPLSGLGLIHMSNSKDEKTFRRMILKVTMESAANPNTRTSTDMQSTGLVYHLEEGNFSLACLLLEYGADPAIPCLDGWTALHMAAWTGATSFLSKLLYPQNGRQAVDWEVACQFRHDSENCQDVTPLHLAAARSIEFLTTLLEKVPRINLAARTDNGLTALHFAARWGSIDCVEALVSRGADVNARSVDGRLALHMAVVSANLSGVERLLELGSENTATLDGMTPLLLAYQINHTQIISCLKSCPASVEVLAPSATLVNTISCAIRAGNLLSSKNLLEAGNSVDIDMSQSGCTGATPLGIAIDAGKLPIIMWLLEKGANANFRYVNGTSGLHDMIEQPLLNPALQTMLDRYLADGGSLLTEQIGLINVAVAADNTEGLSLLLNHIESNEEEYEERAGAPRFTGVSLAVNRKQDGMMPLHRAVILNNKAAVELLLNYGADIEARDLQNSTPLLVALESPVQVDRTDITHFLIQAGSNIHVRNTEGATALGIACRSGKAEIIDSLASVAADMHLKDQKGRNVLHYLLLGSDLPMNSTMPSMFAKALEYGVNPHSNDEFGWSALHMGLLNRCLTTFLLNSEIPGFGDFPIPWTTTDISRRLFKGAVLTSGFRFYRRKLSPDSLRSLLNLEPVGASSPLCQTAAMGDIEAMENLLSVGGHIDFEGSPDGSALMVATRAGLLESAVFLVRRGASISFQGRHQFWSAVKLSAHFPRLLHWLIADRFMDQPKLNEASHESQLPVRDVKCWSGILKFEMIILGPWERSPSEASREYWSRLSRMKQEFAGNIAPPDNGTKTRRRSKLIPLETVRIAAGGYENLHR